MAAPAATADAVGELRTGDAAYVSDDQRSESAAWLEVKAPLEGWILRETRSGPSVDRIEQHGLDDLAVPDSLFAGPGGQFLMGGWDTASASYLLGVTTGAGRWHRTDPPAGTDYVRAAYGPRHWVALAIGRSPGPRAWLWQSDDGSSWSSLGDASASCRANGLGLIQLVG